MIEERKENTEIILWLKQNFIPFSENYDLKKKSWIKCGGIVKLLIEPENFEDILKYYYKDIDLVKIK